MEGFCEEAPVTSEVLEMSEKFQKKFENISNRKFETYVPQTFLMKLEDNQTRTYIVKIQLDDEIRGEIWFNRDPNNSHLTVLKIGTEGGNQMFDLV